MRSHEKPASGGEPLASTTEVTALLAQWRGGDSEAADQVFRLTYDELHRIAVGHFRRERPDHTLQATAVVHEAYMSLVERNGVQLESRAHFLGFMACVMRRVLIDHARGHGRQRRGGHLRKVTLDETRGLSKKGAPDMIELDDALEALSRIDQRKATLVEMRFFGGLTFEEVAEVLTVSRATAVREWQRARAWLFRELDKGAGHGKYGQGAHGEA